jgi:TonB family protein
MIQLKKHIRFILPIVAILFIIACSTQKPAPVAQEPVKETALPAIDTEYYSMVETPATFNGGDINTFVATHLKKNTKYPAAALKKRQQGTVVVQFGIDWNGKLNVFSVLKSSGVKTLDDEAVRALKTSPAWQPAKNKTQAVGQLFMLYFKFNAKTKKVEIS